MTANAQPLEILEDLLKRAKAKGAEAADCLIVRDISLNVAQRLGKREKLERSEAQDLGLRVFIGKRQAIVSTSDLEPKTLDELAERAVAMARAVPEDEFCGLADPALLVKTPVALDLEDKTEPSETALTDMIARAEDAARAVPGVTNSEGAEADEERENTKAWLRKQLTDAQQKLAAAGDGNGTGGNKGDAALRARITELETALADQKKVHKKELGEERAKRVGATKASWLERIRNGLRAHGKIKDKPAKYLFVDEEFQKTIQWDEDGNPKFLDGEGAPIAGDTPDAVLAAFAEQSRRFVESDDLLPKTAGPGGGSQNGDGGGAHSSGYDAEKAGKEMAAKQKGQGPRNEAAFR